MLESPRAMAQMADLKLPPPIYDWKWMVRSLLRHPFLVLFFPLLFGLVAVAYVQLRAPSYTASAVLEISNIRLSPGASDPIYVEALFDPTFMETQIQIIASEPIARTVLGPVSDGEIAEQTALRALRDGLSVERVGQSNLVRIAYSDLNAQEAARKANAIATAYLEKLQINRDSTALSANSWQRDRLREVGARAQIISPATPPINGSNARGMLIIAGAVVAGGIVGALITLVMGFLDRRMRDASQIAAVSGVDCLGIVPYLDNSVQAKHADVKDAPFSLLSAAPILHYIDRGPGTPLWHAVRSAGAVRSVSAGGTRRVAVTSTLSGEGKTTIAANYALLAAKAGQNVLLVDAQAYDPKLTRLLAPQVGGGLVNFLSTPKAQLSRYVLSDTQTGVRFLPFGSGAVADGHNVLWTNGMEKLFEQARDYDLIVLDMPPLVATGDMRAAAPFVDDVLLVVEWNKVTENQLSAALALAGPVQELLMGVIFNKASLRFTARWLSPELDIVAQQTRLAHKKPS